jgi:hypothetical protein
MLNWLRLIGFGIIFVPNFYWQRWLLFIRLQQNRPYDRSGE